MPKSIAIPPNPSARVGGRRAAARKTEPGDDTVMLSPALAKPARSARPQPAHRYHIGERLRMRNGGYSVARAAAYCKVVLLLPYEGRGALLYRVRSETESFERIVAEADLSRNVETA